jgi:hypothetical protein
MVTHVLVSFFSSRLICSVFVYLGHSHHPYLQPVPGGWEGVASWWVNPWTTYDSEWFLQIAVQGYQSHTTSFFPLYPWLLRLFGPDPIHMAIGGILLSHISFFIALLLIYRLTALEWDENVAKTTVWLVALSPAAPYFGAVYTESLFMALLAATFLAVRCQRWWLAGLFGGLAALLRNPGFLIAGALFLEARNCRWSDGPISKRLNWILPLGAFGAVQTGFWVEFGSPLAGVTSQVYFHRLADWPWKPLLGDLFTLIMGSYGMGFFLVGVTSVLFTLTGLLYPLIGWRKVPASYILLVFGITLMNLAYARQILPYTISSPRYLAVLFPISQLAAVLLVRNVSPRMRLLFICSVIYLYIVYSYMFGQKIFLG